MRSLAMLVFLCTAIWTAACFGQEPDQAESSRDLREKRMELLRQRVVALEAVGHQGEEIPFSEKPVLRYNDTSRGVLDATVWVLGRQGRPRAVLVLEVYNPSNVQYEWTAVADPPQHVQMPDWRWSPPQVTFDWTSIPLATPPRETPNLRKRQMKQLVQDFAASEEYLGQTYQLRLMPQPIYEYEDEEQGILGGAVFAWAHGTNVEILMFVEARREEGSPQWVAGFSRLASASLDVTYQQQDFWSSPKESNSGPGDAYFHRGQLLTPEEQAVFIPE